MFLNFLLMSSLFLMSDRENFWDANKISSHTEIVLDMAPEGAKVDVSAVKGKRIMLLIHGFNVSGDSAIKNYQIAHGHIANLKDANNNPVYDVVVGYLWPGYNHGVEYYLAKHNAAHLAAKLRDHLSYLSDATANVDIFAHSMGNYLTLEALKNPIQLGSKKPVGNFFSMAAAVNDESIEKGQVYYNSVENCQNVFVFYSSGDEVLQWAYKASEFDNALGYLGPQDPTGLAPNVQFVDCSQYIHGHSQYYDSMSVFNIIQEKILMKQPTVEGA